MALKHYRNSNIKYTKELFAKHNIAKAKGRLVAVSNGGYHTKLGSPDFGYRLYYDKNTNLINVQIVSEINNKLGRRFVREYSVPLEGCRLADKLDTIQNAILYKEYCDRVVLNKRKAIEVRKQAK